MGYHFRERDNYVRILELTPALRREIEATIESLISLLDRYDGDEDIEENGDEQECSLGWTTDESIFRGPLQMDDLEDEHDGSEDGGDDEPTLGACERHPTSFENLWAGVRRTDAPLLRHVPVPGEWQETWDDGGGVRDCAWIGEREIEDEHGGDILDQPHDEEPDDEDGGDCEPTLGAPERPPSAPGFSHVFNPSWDIGSQEHWADGVPGDDEREEENEHGGDILDQPHDPEPDDEDDEFADWDEDLQACAPCIPCHSLYSL